MGKYIIIQDMTALPSYRCVNARLVYMHVAMRCDIGTYIYATSLRRLAMELDMTVDAVRHALKLLMRDALLEKADAPQDAPQGAPQKAPQKAPQITYLKISRKSTASSTASTTASTTDSTTDSTIDKNINNNYYLHTPDADMRARTQRAASAALGIDMQTAAVAMDAFISRQRLKNHCWEDEGDFTAHFIAWEEKRLPRPQNGRNSAPRSDHDARNEERRRAEEAFAARSEDEKKRDELAKMMRWKREAEERKDTRQAKMLEDAIRTLMAS